MDLLQNEAIIMSSYKDEIVLTNLRIFKTIKSQQAFLFLENVSLIKRITKTKPRYLAQSSYFLFLGVLLVTISFAFSDYGEPSPPLIIAGTIAIIACVVLYVFWLIDRTHMIEIDSKGGKSLQFSVNFIKSKSVDEFLHAIQEAKLNRVNKLFGVEVAV